MISLSNMFIRILPCIFLFLIKDSSEIELKNKITSTETVTTIDPLLDDENTTKAFLHKKESTSHDLAVESLVDYLRVEDKTEVPDISHHLEESIFNTTSSSSLIGVHAIQNETEERNLHSIGPIEKSVDKNSNTKFSINSSVHSTINEINESPLVNVNNADNTTVNEINESSAGADLEKDVFMERLGLVEESNSDKNDPATMEFSNRMILSTPTASDGDPININEFPDSHLDSWRPVWPFPKINLASIKPTMKFPSETFLHATHPTIDIQDDDAIKYTVAKEPVTAYYFDLSSVSPTKAVGPLFEPSLLPDNIPFDINPDRKPPNHPQMNANVAPTDLSSLESSLDDHVRIPLLPESVNVRPTPTLPHFSNTFEDSVLHLMKEVDEVIFTKTSIPSLFVSSSNTRVSEPIIIPEVYNSTTTKFQFSTPVYTLGNSADFHFSVTEPNSVKDIIDISEPVLLSSILSSRPHPSDVDFTTGDHSNSIIKSLTSASLSKYTTNLMLDPSMSLSTSVFNEHNSISQFDSLESTRIPLWKRLSQKHSVDISTTKFNVDLAHTGEPELASSVIIPSIYTSIPFENDIPIGILSPGIINYPAIVTSKIPKADEFSDNFNFDEAYSDANKFSDTTISTSAAATLITAATTAKTSFSISTSPLDNLLHSSTPILISSHSKDPLDIFTNPINNDLDEVIKPQKDDSFINILPSFITSDSSTITSPKSSHDSSHQKDTITNTLTLNDNVVDLKQDEQTNPFNHSLSSLVQTATSTQHVHSGFTPMLADTLDHTTQIVSTVDVLNTFNTISTHFDDIAPIAHKTINSSKVMNIHDSGLATVVEETFNTERPSVILDVTINSNVNDINATSVTTKTKLTPVEINKPLEENNLNFPPLLINSNSSISESFDNPTDKKVGPSSIESHGIPMGSNGSSSIDSIPMGINGSSSIESDGDRMVINEEVLETTTISSDNTEAEGTITTGSNAELNNSTFLKELPEIEDGLDMIFKFSTTPTTTTTKTTNNLQSTTHTSISAISTTSTTSANEPTSSITSTAESTTSTTTTTEQTTSITTEPTTSTTTTTEPPTIENIPDDFKMNTNHSGKHGSRRTNKTKTTTMRTTFKTAKPITKIPIPTTKENEFTAVVSHSKGNEPQLNLVKYHKNGTNTSILSPFVKAAVSYDEWQFCQHQKNIEALLKQWINVHLANSTDGQPYEVEIFHQPNCENLYQRNLTLNEFSNNKTNVYFYVKENGGISPNSTLSFPKNPTTLDISQELEYLKRKILHLELVNAVPTEDLLIEEAAVGTSIVVIVVVTTILILLVIVSVLVYIMVRKRRLADSMHGRRCTPAANDAYSLDSVSVFYHSIRRKSKKRASNKSLRSYLNQGFDDPNGPSRILNFAKLTHFITDNEAIYEEFAQIPSVIPKYDEMPRGVEDKNRYANVIPVPETRILLSKSKNTPCAEYINANSIHGPRGELRYYIATQAPLDNTVADFWQMVWEQECKVIVMLTDFVEKGMDKCADYLPPSETLDCHRVYGEFQITLKSRDMREKYVVSLVQIKNLENNLVREIAHMWYTGWPPSGVPNEEKFFISFIMDVRTTRKQLRAKGPIIVHCSPGTGRTGTYISCDLSMRQFDEQKTIDVPKTVYRIRRERAGAVQTKEQYAFIYRVANLYAAKLTTGNLDSF